jgi:hypothetical protein
MELARDVRASKSRLWITFAVSGAGQSEVESGAISFCCGVLVVIARWVLALYCFPIPSNTGSWPPSPLICQPLSCLIIQIIQIHDGIEILTP